MKILTLNEAIEKCPSIAADKPSPKVSNRYSFISTKNVLEKALDSGWVITDKSFNESRIRLSKSNYATHGIRLFHKEQLMADQSPEGWPSLSIINSHDCSKRFAMAVGFYRLVCSNGLMVASGIANNVSTKHNLNQDHETLLSSSIDKVFNQYEVMMNQINDFKNRDLSEEEKLHLAEFAKRIRFRFRPSQPRKIEPVSLLQSRRKEDEGNDLWKVFNVIQENISRGGGSLGKGITRFEDDLKFNTEMWSGVTAALTHKQSSLKTHLDTLFVKKEYKKKSSSQIFNN